MDMNTINTVLGYAGDIIAAASAIVAGIAMITKITPSTTDDEIITKTQSVLKTVQKVIGMFALDSGATSKTTASKTKPG